MSIILPSAINLHNLDPDGADPHFLENINGATSTGVKSGGNLPINSGAAQFLNAGIGSKKGLAFNIPTPFNANTLHKVMVWSNQFNAPNRIQVDNMANDGVMGRLYSSAGNYREYLLGGNDSPYGASQGGAVCFAIDPLASGYKYETGTFDTNSVGGYGFTTVHLRLIGSSSNQSFFQRCYLFGTEKNAVDIPKFTGVSDFDDIILEVLGTNYTNKKHVFVARADTAYTVICPFQIGDGSTPTTFNDNGGTVLSPGNNVASDPRFHLSNLAMRVHLSLTASCAVTISGTYTWGTPAAFNFNSSVGAAVNVSGAVFKNMGQMTLGSDVSGAATYSLGAGSDVVVNGADIDGSTINGDCVLNSANDLSNVTITGDLFINVPANTVLNFSNVMVNGSVFNNSANTLTINLQNGSSVTAGDAGTGGGQTDIAIAYTLTFTGLQDGTECRVFRTADNTEIVGVESSIGGTFSAPANFIGNVFYVIHHIDYEYILIENQELGGANVVVPIQQQPDSTYKNP